jgi:hypothetical protein
MEPARVVGVAVPVEVPWIVERADIGVIAPLSMSDSYAMVKFRYQVCIPPSCYTSRSSNSLEPAGRVCNELRDRVRGWNSKSCAQALAAKQIEGESRSELSLLVMVRQGLI